ncbi:MAG: ribosome-associated protein [Alteromonadaceae bacterium]|jgi:ribosome-associated protein|tara:strand:+ start:302 stop:712 length:411 start_codon:yes stop_codon:yes gene_type:complete
MLEISNAVSLGDWEIELSAIRSQGNGGQRVNKVATAIHLRFDINSSSLPASYKERLLKLKDSRITADGIIIIKAQSFRTQEQNKDNALKRLKEIIVAAMVIQRVRRVTKPTRSSQRKRIENKKQRSNTKALRGKVT